MAPTTPTSAAGPVDGSVRVSLREIREVGYRALSALGASHGEASVAARMAQGAEVQHHEGIRTLLLDLERGPWRREEVDLVQTGGQGRGDIRLGAPATNRLLQHGPLAVDLAAADLDGGGVFVPGEVSGTACLDAVLLEVADARQCSVAVMATGPGDACVVRVARADGALGFGCVTGSVGEAGSKDDGEEGWWVRAPAPQSWEKSDLTWVSAAERADARAAVARESALVPAAQWWPIYAASRRYLVA